MWDRQVRARDRRQGTLGEVERSRVVNWGFGQTDGGLMSREFQGEGKLERVTLGSFAGKSEWGGTYTGEKCISTGRGIFSDTGHMRGEGLSKY